MNTGSEDGTGKSQMGRCYWVTDICYYGREIFDSLKLTRLLWFPDPVFRSMDYVRSGIKNWFCLMPVHTCVTESDWNVGFILYHWGASFLEDVPLVQFMYLVFTRMLGESYRTRLRSLLYLCYVFWAQINSLAGWFWHGCCHAVCNQPLTSTVLRFW